MNSIRIKKLKMYATLRILLRTNPAVLAKLPNGEEYLTKLDEAIIGIETNTDLKEEGTEEVKERKRLQKLKLVESLLENIVKLRAYAKYMNDNLLIAFCDVTENKLMKLDDPDLVRFAKSLYSRINDHLADLGRYLLTADTQAALLDLTTKYDAITPELEQAKGGYKNLSNKVDNYFDKANDVVDKITTEIELVRTSDPEFYSEYQISLRIERKSSTSNDMIGYVIDAETGAGLPNANLTFTLDNSTAAPIVKTSASKGGFQLKTIDPGVYTVVITKIGYQTQTQTITVIGDDQFSLEVKLVKA